MALSDELTQILPAERVLTRPIDRIAYSSDASFYRLVPQAVVQPVTNREVESLFAFSKARGIPLTFRAAGTSLSGQAVTDGILVDVSKHWGKLQVESGGARVRLQPGVIGGYANAVLRSHSRRIGPDPASIDTCMMGGILANNSSGMCCGVIENAYRTLDSIQFVLPNGQVIDTAASHAAQILEETSPDIVRGLLELKERVRSNPELSQRIRERYRIKNTTGYSLNAFVDFDTPLDILSHLLIGSEGTLAFISEAVLRTLPAYPYKYTGLLYFADVQSASRAIQPLRDSGARALELMDRASLRSIEHLPGAPGAISQLPEQAAGLLVEYQSETAELLAGLRQSAASACQALELVEPPEFTEDANQQAALWKLRKGLIPAIGAVRRQGTSVLIEDVAFAVRHLADAVTDLQRLFRKYAYEDAIIFGHAKDGNLHFVLTQSFNDQASITRFGQFMQDMVDMVVGKYDGALKAEHGTGRNIAPFVETEWGPEAYAIMQEIKALIDPDAILNPGVVINPDPQAHLKNLKSLPVIEAEVDQCIECGFCEPKCPSRRLTLTPRQRIVVRRQIARLKAGGADAAMLASLEADYAYDGLDTCATDGLCATTCPVLINTGDLVKRLRAEAVSSRAAGVASSLSEHFGALEGVLRTGVSLGHAAQTIVGPRPIAGMARLAEPILGRKLPKWNASVPRSAPARLPASDAQAAQAVYFPSCITRVMGNPPGDGRQMTVIEALMQVAARAGKGLWVPPDCGGHCCGMPFGSKGYQKAYHETVAKTIARFWEWSQGGQLPIIIDASSCAYTLRTCEPILEGDLLEKWQKLRILDSVEFVHDFLLPHLPIKPLDEAVVLHPNCAARKLGLEEKFVQVASACAASVDVPLNLSCCAFAGDRGLLFPELTASATSQEAEEVLSRPYDGYYSSNLTCEMGMAQATGKPYRSFLYLVEKATR